MMMTSRNNCSIIAADGRKQELSCILHAHDYDYGSARSPRNMTTVTFKHPGAAEHEQDMTIQLEALTGRSPVLRAMLTGPFLEASSHAVDLSAEPIEQVLAFLALCRVTVDEKALPASATNTLSMGKTTS